MALRSNPTLFQAAADIRAAGGRTLQAGLYPNPTVGYTGEEIGAGDRAGQQGLFVEQRIVTGGKLALKQTELSNEVTKAQLRAAVQEYRVLNAVRTQFTELLLQEQLVENHKALLAITQEAVTTTEELLNVGQSNQPDLLQARAEAHRENVSLQKAIADRDAAWTKLTATVGVPELGYAPVTGTLDSTGAQLEWDSTLTNLVATSPELQIAHAEVQRAQWAVRRQQAEPIPDIRLRGGAEYNFETNDPQAELEIGFRLPLFDANQGNIQTACAELSRAQAELTRVELSLRERLATAFANYTKAKATAEAYRSSILPETRDAYELYLASFRNHRAAWPQVLIAQRTYAQSSKEFLEALASLRRAEIFISSMLLEPAEPSSFSERDLRDNESRD